MQKKAKISPKDYKSILRKIELEDISLINSTFSKAEANFPAKLKLKEKNKVDYKVDDKNLIVFYNYLLTGKGEKNNLIGIKIKVDFRLMYSIANDVEITDEFFEIFSHIAVTHSIWPYIREYIQNVTSRMNLPPLTLPLIKLM